MQTNCTLNTENVTLRPTHYIVTYNIHEENMSLEALCITEIITITNTGIRVYINDEPVTFFRSKVYLFVVDFVYVSAIILF